MKNKILLLLPIILISFTFISAIDISNCQELQNMSNDLTGNYVLTQNIDCSDTVNWNSGAGFIPIGYADEGTMFMGNLDGQNYAINDLYINRNDGYTGLFGYVRNSNISNVNLKNVNITGTTDVGGLVGVVDGLDTGTIENCNVSGSVTGTDFVGGLLGELVFATLTNSHSSAIVNSNINTYTGEIGGLVGDDYGIINNSYATGDVVGLNRVGGLAGYVDYAYNPAYIYNSYATGDVQGVSSVGGLVGENDNIIINSYATGDVSSVVGVGGLVGEGVSGTIINSYATGNVAGSSTNFYAQIGGLIGGEFGGLINNSYATGDVSGAGGGTLGGLIGWMHDFGTVENSYAIGHLSGYNFGGGLSGRTIDSSTINCFWDTDTSGTLSDGYGSYAIGKTTSEMKDITTYSDVGWTISLTSTHKNNGYPFLSEGNWLITKPTIIQKIVGVGKTTRSDTLVSQTQLPSGEQPPITKISLFQGIKNFFQNIINWFNNLLKGGK